MIMKRCFKCGESKSYGEFYKHPRMKDGHTNKCKECTKQAVCENYRRNIDHYREYERERAMLPHRIDARKRYQLTEEGRKSLQKAKSRWRERNHEKYKAHCKVSNAIRDGKLQKKRCEECGSTNSHAHHDDYNKPLDVRWLCSMHHRQWHKEND